MLLQAWELLNYPSNGESLMKPCPARILTSALVIILVCAACVPVVTAEKEYPSSPACVNPKYPRVDFDTEYPGSITLGVSLLGVTYDGPPYRVEFTDTSAYVEGQPISSYYWDFGDGTTSTQKNPAHIYASPGTYNGMHSVTTICGADYSKKITFTIKILCSKAEAGFTSNVYQGTAPLTVQITDTSTHTPSGITTWTYRFDSTHTSNNRNPSFTFTEPGIYTITQTVSKSCPPVPLELPKATRQITVYPKVAASTVDDHTWVSVTTTTIPTLAFTTTTSATTSATAVLTPAAGASVQSTTAQNTPAGSVQQTAPPTPGTGTLSVITNPAGAQVFVDDMPWGAGPATIPNLAAGAHTLRLEMAGYQDLRVPVTITDGKASEYSLALVPVAGSAGSSSPVTLPFIAGAVIILVLAAGGAYLYTKRKKAP